jgi:hypothetical protein
MEPIQSLWIGDRLSRVEALSIRSFLAHGHPYHLYAYAKLAGVPDGVRVFDANAIVPEQYIFRTAGSLSIFSDWFRQELLFQRGGYWADLDLVCLKPLDFDDPIVLGKVDCSRVSNALMRFPAGHAVTRHLADVSREPNMVMPFDSAADRRRKLVRKYLLGNRRNNVEWGEASGPSGMTRMVKHHGLWALAKPYYYFHPVHFSFWACAFDGTFEEGLDFFASSYTVHLWNEKIRRAGRDKDGPFQPGSLVARLMEKYRVT